MKKVKNLAALAALFVAGLFAACTNEPPVTPPTEPVALKLTFTVSGGTGSSTTIEVTPSHDDVSYYWGVIPESDYRQFSDIDKLKNADIERFMQTALAQDVSVEEVIAQSLSKGADRKTFGNLAANTDYIVYGYAMDKGVETTDELSYKDFKAGTGIGPARLEVEVKATRMTQIDVTVTPESIDILYYLYRMSDEEYQAFGGNIDGALDFFHQTLQYSADMAGTTPKEYLTTIRKRGVLDTTHRPLEAETTYWFYAVEVNTDGDVVGISGVSATTTERVMVPMSFDIEVSGITQTAAIIEVKPSNKTQPYYFEVLPKSNYDRYSTDEEFMKAYVESTGADRMAMFLSTGDDRLEIGTSATLIPGMDYIVIAFAFNETFISELAIENFSSLSTIPLADFKVEMEATYLGATRAHLLFTPNDSSIPYTYWYMTKEFYDSYPTPEEAVQAAINQQIATYQAQYPDETPQRLIELMTRFGQRFYQTQANMIPDTDYYMWAAAINVEGVIISPPSLQPFRTAEYVLGNATVDFVIDHYFDGAQILGGEQYKDYFVAVVSDVTVTNSTAWYNMFIRNDYTSKTTYPEYLVSSWLYNNVSSAPWSYCQQANTVLYVSKTSAGTLTHLAVAIEKGSSQTDVDLARFGPTMRKLYTFSMEGCSPASLFPDNIGRTRSTIATQAYYGKEMFFGGFDYADATAFPASPAGNGVAAPYAGKTVR